MFVLGSGTSPLRRRVTACCLFFLLLEPMAGCTIGIEHDMRVVFCGMSRHVPLEHTMGWYFSDVGDEFTGNNADLVRLRTALESWDDDE